MKRSTGTPVNLLPLLDVLLCTMGTLIVVLGVLNRLTRTHSVNQAREDRAIAKEQITLRIEQLSASREKTIADLDMARRQLSGAEDHSRQLADKLKTLAAAAGELDSKKPEDDKRESLRCELGQLNSERWGVEKELEAARHAGVQHKLMFSIVPFDGVYKSNRRPIYIECRGDAIILQPEGIVFTPADFLGPPGPGNPLASALRATQEYWSQLPPPAPDVNNEPYPLLLVRPDGIIAYYLARDAMASWNTEFGYELISADGKLEFPAAPEPRLVDMEKRAVAEARQRLQWLAQVSPEAFQHKQKTQYRVSAIRGGLVRDGAPSLGNDPFANDPLGGFGKSAGGRTSGNGSTDYGPGGANPDGSGNTADGNVYRGGNGDVPSELRLADVRGNRGLGGSGYGPGNGSGDYGAGGYGPDGYGGNGSTGLGMNRNAIGGNGSGGGDRMFSSGGNGNDALGPGGTGRASGGTAGLSGSGAGNVQGEGSLVGPRYSQSGGGLNSQGLNGGGESNPGGAGGPQLSGTQLGGPQLGGPAGANSFGTTGGRLNGAPANGTGQFSGGASPGGNGSFSTSGDMAARGTGNSSAGSPSGGGSMQEGDSSSCDGSCASGGGSSSGSASASSSSMSQSDMSSGAESSQMAAGIPSPSLNFNANQQRTSRKLANERGRNWAIQNNTNSSVPITRPIRIECWNDRLILVPDGHDQQPQVIPLADRTDEAVDQLVAAVRVHTQGWGLAGRSMYWKPQLLLDVKPTAESRAADLAVLLADSGLDVKRK